MLESLLNKVAGSHALWKRDSSTRVFLWNLRNVQEHAGGCFWKFEKWLCWANVYPTTKKNPPQNNFEKKIAFVLSRKEWCAERKMPWERGWQIKSSCIHLIYFYLYSVATGMANMFPKIFISNVLLKNPTERNA